MALRPLIVPPSAAPLPPSDRCRTSFVLARSLTDELLEGLGREGEPERRPFSRHGRGRELAAVGLHQPPADPQAQPRAGRSGLGPAEELGEDAREVGAGNALPLVGYRYCDHVGLVGRRAALAADADAFR